MMGSVCSVTRYCTRDGQFADVTLEIACYACSITTCPIIGAPSTEVLHFSAFHLFPVSLQNQHTHKSKL